MKATRQYRPHGWQLDHQNLDTGTVQLWHNGIMLTAQVKLNDAKQRVINGEAFVITSQAIGTMKDGISTS